MAFCRAPSTKVRGAWVSSDLIVPGVELDAASQRQCGNLLDVLLLQLGRRLDECLETQELVFPGDPISEVRSR